MNTACTARLLESLVTLARRPLAVSPRLDHRRWTSPHQTGCLAVAFCRNEAATTEARTHIGAGLLVSVGLMVHLLGDGCRAPINPPLNLGLRGVRGQAMGHLATIHDDAQARHV